MTALLAADGGQIQAHGHPMTPIPFKEAIAWAIARGVVLPEVYYGELQGLARAMAFSISGLTKLDQLQAVKDSLDAILEQGGTLREWQQRVKAGDIGLDLPAHRLENIYRTNIQGNYARGRCEQQKRTAEAFPWRMYDAINDSRTRPAHAAMDGFVARHDDPIWKTWTPPNGYQCRCRVIAMTDKQAAHFQAADARRMQDPEYVAARAAARPDKGWDYSVCTDPTEGLRRAISRKQDRCAGGGQFAVDYSVWCRHPALIKSIEDMIGSLNDWNDPAKLLVGVLGRETYERLVEESKSAAQAHRLTEPQGVVLRAYTDRDLDAWPLMNQLARALPHTEPLRLSDHDLYRAGILVQIMDAALVALPAVAGVFRRGVDSLDMQGALRVRFLAAHRQDVIVQYEGYTSIMAGAPYLGDVHQEIEVSTARDIQAFSANHESELVLPRQVSLMLSAMTQGPGDLPQRVMIMTETTSVKAIPNRRKFATDAERDRARMILDEVTRLQAQLGAPTQAEADFLERCTVEAGAPIPARFKHLQYLNKKH